MTRARDEHGLSESTQWATLASTLLVVVLGLLQYGLWWHASNVAQAAADAAAEVAAVIDGSAGQAQAAGLRVAAAGDLREAQVSVAVSSTGVAVTVTGRPITFVPWDRGLVTATAQLAKEPER